MATKHMHIIPDEDWIDHEFSTSCVCGPKTEVRRRPDGTLSGVVTHYSLSGEYDKVVE